MVYTLGIYQGVTPASKSSKAKTSTRNRKMGARAIARGFAEDKAKWGSPSPDASPQTAVAKLFMNGRSQAVRLPKEFRLPGDKVRVRREGDTIVLIPFERDWDALWAEIDRLVQGQFPEREQPPMPPDDDLDSFD